MTAATTLVPTIETVLRHLESSLKEIHPEDSGVDAIDAMNTEILKLLKRRKERYDALRRVHPLTKVQWEEAAAREAATDTTGSDILKRMVALDSLEGVIHLGTGIFGLPVPGVWGLLVGTDGQLYASACGEIVLADHKEMHPYELIDMTTAIRNMR